MAMIKTCKMPVLQEKSASGSVATFNTALAMPLKSCTSLISGYQEGSGTPSPDNVRPLHAFSSADLYFNTINQWDEVAEIGTIDTTTGKNISNNSRLRSTNYVLVVPNTTYYIKMPTANNEYILWYEYDSNKNFIRYLYKSNGTTVTTTSNTRFVRFSTIDYGTIYNNDISINYPATDTSYHAFSGAVFTFGQSIYQGSIDWKRGVVVGTHGIVEFDGSSDENWTDYTNYNGFRLNISDMKSGNYMNGLANWLKTITSHEYGIRFGAENTLIYCEYIKDNISEVTDLTSWKTYLSNNPLQLAYELATPIEIPLGGINLLTQEGQNNIFCNTGDVDLTYKDLDIAKRGNFREVFRLP